MNYRDLIRRMEQDGWHHIRIEGSHRVDQHPAKEHNVVIAGHSRGDDAPHRHIESYPQAAWRQYIKIAHTAAFEQEIGGGWAAYVPDLPTVLASADSHEETECLVREGIELYIELFSEEGKPLPPAAFQTQRIEVIAHA